MYTKNEIMETIKMIQEENLDVRTITMGISLIDCMDTDIDKSCEKIYNKIYLKDILTLDDALWTFGTIDYYLQFLGLQIETRYLMSI